MANEPSSPPTCMLVVEVVDGEVTESLDSTAVLVDPHSLSPESSWYCV